MPKSFEIKCTGYSIAADWYDGDTKNVLLILPGYTSSKAHQAEFTSALVHKTGMAALVIDYTGHGDSPFELRNTRPAQHLLEIIYAFDWIRTQYPATQISVAGSSYGSFLAALLTEYRQFNKLVLRAPAIYRPEAFYDLWSVRLDDEENYRIAAQAYRHDSAALAKHPTLIAAAAFKGKALIAVHEHDELVPRATTDAYINAFNADSFIAKDFIHGIAQSPITKQQIEAYQDHIADWLRS